MAHTDMLNDATTLTSGRFYCSNDECNSTRFETDPHTYNQVCSLCGGIVEQTFNQTATKAAGGGLERNGTDVDIRNQNYSHGREVSGIDNQSSEEARNDRRRRLRQVFEDHAREIAAAIDPRNQKLNGEAVNSAANYWEICFDAGYTHTRCRRQLAGVILYTACRTETPPLPYPLVDFAGVMEMNVYKLAKEFQNLCVQMKIQVKPLTDPILYIPRFTKDLEYGASTPAVEQTTTKIVNEMKRHWISTGRQPAGICGAAIYVASKMHGFKRSKEDIAEAVGLTVHTIKKRIQELINIRELMPVGHIHALPLNDARWKSGKRSNGLPPCMQLNQKAAAKEYEQRRIAAERAAFDKKWEEEHGNDGTDSSECSFGYGEEGDDNRDSQNHNISREGMVNEENKEKEGDDEVTDTYDLHHFDALIPGLSEEESDVEDIDTQAKEEESDTTSVKYEYVDEEDDEITYQFDRGDIRNGGEEDHMARLIFDYKRGHFVMGPRIITKLKKQYLKPLGGNVKDEEDNDEDDLDLEIVKDEDEKKFKAAVFDVAHPDYKSLELQRTKSRIKRKREEDEREERLRLKNEESFGGPPAKRLKSERTNQEAFDRLTGKVPEIKLE